ncbi:hypothetical protein BT96DRAFT_927274 [Gymnopus androsaceus JB14]|uniref:Hydrophobin n=1 Tax=Gymnopus androsaceus JB14 TaxID=1447944 RepID=A0A6A4GS33_9AGAR|nr:hypothetical protein BT96DRAFT_927274 [Gymnopus androsaceus JB14]
MSRFSNFVVVVAMLLFIQASVMTVQAMPSSERRTVAIPRTCGQEPPCVVGIACCGSED